MHGFSIKTFPHNTHPISQAKTMKGFSKFKNVLPAEASNYIFIKLDNFFYAM
jgi:hypothetical protein